MRKKLTVVLGFIVLAIAAALGAAIVTSLGIQSDVMAKLEAKGYPTTTAEVEPPRESIPAEENAALYFEAAAQNLVGAPREFFQMQDDGTGNSPSRPSNAPKDSTAPLSAKQMGLVDGWLSSNKPALDLLHKGATLEKGLYSNSLATDLQLDSTVPRGANLSANLLFWEAVYRAEQGNSEGVVESVHTTLRLGDSLFPYSILLYQATREDACYGFALKALDRCLARTTFSDAQLARLSDDLLTAERLTEPGMGRAIAGEMAFASFPLSSWQKTGFRSAMGKMVLAADAPTQDRLAKVRAAQPSEILITLRSLQTMPGIYQWVEGNLKTLAKLRAARTGVALERYRLAHGTLPESLDALVPAYLDAVPLDPYNGRELRYKRMDQGCYVYSLGECGADMAGKPGMDGANHYFRLHR